MTFTISRYTVTDPERADAPRPRRELNALRALGAILNKPQWWLKRSRADVKAKWAMEIDEALVRANVAQVVRVWPSPYAILRTLQPLVELARSTAENKESEIQRHLEHVTYPHGYQDKYDGFGMGNSYESDDDLGEAAENWSEICKQYDATAVETDFETVRRHHESLNAFGEIGWYVTMDIVRERLQSLSLAEWTGENVENLIEGELMKVEAVTRTTDLLLAIRRDEHPLSLHTVKRHLPRESRENVLKLVLLHVQRIVEYLSTARKDIDTILELIAKQERLCDETAKRTQHSTPGPVPKTRLSDDAVPPETKRKFVENVAALENVPDDQKDWHPNSGNQVLDLIHPSLFCGVIGKTKALPVSARDDIEGNVVDHFKSIMFRPTPDGLGGPRGIKYQWLPSEFDVSSDGQSVAIRSYINNLHPEIHSSLYQSIASIFSRFVPLFDHVICSLGSNDTEPDTNLLGEGPTSGLRRLARSTHLGMDPTKFSLKGKRCQVIVKIAEIHLTPEKPDYGGGAWHIEGTDAERIIATGLYYFGCENITESRLSFRTFVCAPDYEQSDDIGIALSYDLHNEQLLIQHLGSLTAMEDRCVVFPNIYQHKVEPFSLADPTKPGVRKILAFFLVDPVNDPIPSTAIIPPQQQEWIDRAHEPEMKRLRLPEVVKSQIQDMTRDGMSLEEAKKVRLKLMDERSPVQDEDYDDEMMFSLCEH